MKTQPGKTVEVALAAAATLARRKVALAVCVVLCTAGLALSASGDEATLITFDAPNDVFGIQPLSINPANAITGYYLDASFVAHGFLRSPDGTVTTFNPPGAA